MAIIRTQPENILTNQDPGLDLVRQIEDRKVVEELNYNKAKPLPLPNNYTVNQVTTIVNTIIQNNPPTGVDGQIQVNENGQLVGDTGLTYVPTTDTLTTGTIVVGNIIVSGVANLGNVNTIVIQGGSPGEVLTSNGTGLVHWATPYPSVANKSGKFLVTDGINVNWSNIAYSSFATTTDVSNAIGNLINSAPTALDTLSELANALGNSGDFTINVVNQLANKVNTSALALVATSGNFSDLNYKPNLSDYLPSQASNSGKYLTTNGTSASWGTVTIPTDIANLTDTTSLLGGGGGIALTDLSIGGDNPASGGGNISYANTTGVFTYTPPVIPDVSGFALSSAIPDVSGFALTSSVPAAQIQSDWTQSTNTALDFIKNKPTLVTNLDSLSDVTITSATSGQVLKYNGTDWINDTDSTGGGGGASTGNVTFDDNIIMGTGDEFGSAGLYLAPGNASIANSAVQYLRVRGGDAPTHIHLDTGNNEFYDQYFGDDGKFVRLDAGDFGNVTIGTQNPGNSFNWSFTSDGNLTLPQGSTIGNTTEIVTVTLDQFTAGGFAGTRVFTKVSDTLYELSSTGSYMTLISNVWRLKVGPATYYDSTDLITWSPIAGALPAPVGTLGTVASMNLGVDSNTWTFAADGVLTLPEGGVISEGGGFTGAIKLTPAGGANEYQALVIYPTAAGDGDHIHLTAGGGTTELYLGNDLHFVKLESDGNIRIQADNGVNGAAWQFGTDGNLNLPGNLVIAGNANVFGTNLSLLQTTDNRPLMALSSGANGAVSSLWVEDIGNVGTSNIAAVYANPISGSKIVRIAVGQNGVGSGPNLWDFGTDGTLTLPAGGDILDSTGNSVIPDVSGFVTGTPWTSEGYVTGTPWTTEGYLTTITNIFDQSLNTTNNVTFNSVITSNVHAVSGAPAIGAPTNAIGGAGSLLTISAGDGGIAATGINAGNGGNLTITAGDAGSDIGNPSWGNIGGTLVLRGGNSSRPYHGSDVQIHSGDSLTSPGLISLHTGTNQWTFGKTGDLTLANNATIIAPADNDLTLVVTVEYNICTLLTGGSGYGGGGSSSAISGGSGTGMMVGYGYGLSGQVVNVSVTTPGTGYVDGDVLTMTAGSGATFVITRYNSAANPNTNTAPADWTFGTDGNLTLPLGGDIVDSLGSSKYVSISALKTLVAASTDFADFQTRISAL